MITLELTPDFARTARANIEHAGFADVVEVRVGPALAALEELVAEGGDPFDLNFIDADKQTTPDYFRLALHLSRPGGVIVVDNVIRDGALIDPATEDRGAIGWRVPRDSRERAGRERDEHPDRGLEGIRRVHARSRGRARAGRGRRVSSRRWRAI